MAICIVVPLGASLQFRGHIHPGDDLISVLYSRIDDNGQRYEVKSHPVKRKDARREMTIQGKKYAAVGYWEFCSDDDRLRRIK